MLIISLKENRKTDPEKNLPYLAIFVKPSPDDLKLNCPETNHLITPILENKQIRRLFKLMVSLMELHDENAFKIRSYGNATAALERIDQPLADLDQKQLELLEGIGKSMASKIVEIVETGSFADLDKLVAATPPGVVQMLDLKGIGPKKIRAIWKDLGAETMEQLLEACEKNELANLKGFGAKTQETIKNAILFLNQNQGKLLYAEAEEGALALEQQLKKSLNSDNVLLSGAFRRRLEIIEHLQVIAETNEPHIAQEILTRIESLEKYEAVSGPFVWRGTDLNTGLKTEIRFVKPENFYQELFLSTGDPKHLHKKLPDGKTLLEVAQTGKFSSENAIFDKAGLQYIEPEMREGFEEIDMASPGQIPTLLTDADLKGILHNHSTYSDGNHTLLQMSEHCRDNGYEYFGICDHSKSAFYANGLQEFRVQQQHQEIDQLNKKMAPFRIFKGIESDILADGSLDYDDSVLASFDFVVASVHSNLNMDVVKATDRLVKAIENPYTTILGHPTGRLLLRREGYPIDHKTVIDACAANEVIIEINANPWRLDIDWRWVPYALEKGVMLSINPDAHSMSGLADMRYGVLMGRKGGLSKEMTFNAKSAEEVAACFVDRKKRKGIL